MSELQTITMQQLQKMGGKIARNQQSYIVSQLLLKHWLLSIHDCTYGQGRFYTLIRDRLIFLSGGDIRIWIPWLVKPDLFILKPVWKQYDVLRYLKVRFDVIVIDPPFSPYNRGQEKRKYYLPSEGLGTPTRIIISGIQLARLLNVPYILLHYNRLQGFGLDIIDGYEYIYRLYGHTQKSYFLLLKV